MSLAFVASASCNALPVRLAQFFRSRSKLGDMCCVRQRARLSCEDCFPCFACPAGPPGSRSPRFAGVARGAVLVREHPWTLRSRPGAVAPACVYVRLVPLDRNQLQKKLFPALFHLAPFCLFQSASSLPVPLVRAFRSSSLEDRGFSFFGLRGPSCRHGWRQPEKLVRLDPGRGQGLSFYRMWAAVVPPPSSQAKGGWTRAVKQRGQRGPTEGSWREKD